MQLEYIGHTHKRQAPPGVTSNQGCPLSYAVRTSACLGDAHSKVDQRCATDALFGSNCHREFLK